MRTRGGRRSDGIGWNGMDVMASSKSFSGASEKKRKGGHSGVNQYDPIQLYATNTRIYIRVKNQSSQPCFESRSAPLIGL